MFEKIYLHVGLPKTGTSYLQNALDVLSRTEALTQTSYPVLNCNEDHTRIQSGNGEAIAFQLLAEMVPEYCMQTVARLTQNLLSAADHSKPNLLISSEHFSNAEPARLAHLLDLLGAHAESVEVLVFLRPMDRLCHSRYHQEVKRHAESGAYNASFFQAFSQQLLEQLDLIGHLPNTVHTFNYKAGGLLAVLLEFLGEDASLQVPFTDQAINRSLTESELHLLRQINAIFKKAELSTRISDRWIYANPHASSVIEHADRTEIFSALRQVVCEQPDRVATPVCEAMLDRLLPAETPNYGKTDISCAVKNAENESSNEDLMRMALEEIASLTRFESGLSAYYRNLSPTRDFFDPVHYLLLNRDVLAAGVDPVEHFKKFGLKEGRFSAFNSISVQYDIG